MGENSDYEYPGYIDYPHWYVDDYVDFKRYPVPEGCPIPFNDWGKFWQFALHCKFSEHFIEHLKCNGCD